jgi:hypothetical protein
VIPSVATFTLVKGRRWRPAPEEVDQMPRLTTRTTMGVQAAAALLAAALLAAALLVLDAGTVGAATGGGGGGGGGGAPIVTLEPAGQTVTAGTTVTFTAAAVGTGTLRVQWAEAPAPAPGTLPVYAPVVGGTRDTLTVRRVTPAMDGTWYVADFEDPVGGTLSDPAVLTVQDAPQITLQPASQSVAYGTTATFTAAAVGDPAVSSVQWAACPSSRAACTALTTNPTASTDTLVIDDAGAADAGYYQATFTNAVGPEATARARLTVVTTALTVSVQPQGGAVDYDTAATLTAAATGDPPPTSVTWQVCSASRGGGTTNPGLCQTVADNPTVHSSTFVIPWVTNLTPLSYRALFTNALGQSVGTDLVAVDAITAAPVVSVEPTDQVASASGAVTFVAGATGTPPPQVQWAESTDGGTTFAEIPGATSPTLTLTGVTAAQVGTLYVAQFGNLAGSAVTSLVSFTLPTVPVFTTQPQDVVTTDGAPVTFTVTATGGAALTYQWETSIDGGATFQPLAGATSPTVTFTTTAADQGLEVRCVATDGGPATSSAPATVTLETVPGPPLEVVAAAAGQLDQAAIIVQWLPPASDGSTPILSYTITTLDIDTGLPGPTVVVDVAPSFTSGQVAITGLNDQDAYTATVTATNGQGSGAASDPSLPALAT